MAASYLQSLHLRAGKRRSPVPPVSGAAAALPALLTVVAVAGERVRGMHLGFPGATCGAGSSGAALSAAASAAKAASSTGGGGARGATIHAIDAFASALQVWDQDAQSKVKAIASRPSAYLGSHVWCGRGHNLSDAHAQQPADPLHANHQTH